VRRILSLLVILSLVPAACSREEEKVPQGKRPPRIAAPTKEEMATEARNELLAKLDPVEKLEKGLLYETPDGEKWVRYPNNMLVHDLRPGNSIEAQWGQTVHIAYTLSLPGSGKVIESRKADNPFDFVLGSRDVIKGMNMGVMGMQIGGRRRIFVPPELAYGKGGAPTSNIGPDQALIFEIELVSITGEALQPPSALPKSDLIGPPAPSGPPAPDTAPATAPGGEMNLAP
jgi:FKBP-type peptidyl-prolyl cis-trans isomerase